MPESEPSIIYVVDDEPAVPEFIGRLLLSDNSAYQVECFGSAPSCLERMAAREPALVVTDIWMPGADGMELLKRCRDGYPEVEVILVTAQPSMPTVMEAIRREACSYLEKPFHSDELRQAVRRALARRRMLRMARHQLERDGAGPMGLDPTLSGAGSFFAAAWEFLPGETIIVDGSQRLVSANRAARARFNLGRRIKPRLREVPPLDRLCGMTAFAEGADRSTTVSQLRLDGKLVRAVWAEFLDGVKFCIVWFGG